MELTELLNEGEISSYKKSLKRGVNRLIIIGNGFDLAHGLNSGFNHFIGNYLISVLDRFNQKYEYDDQLIQISLNTNKRPRIDDFYHNFNAEELNIKDILSEFKKISSNKYLEVKFFWKSTFFKNIYNNLDRVGWVDIEIEYFDLLKGFNGDTNVESNKKQIIKLNSELEYLKSRLIQYLDKEQGRFEIKPYPPLLDQLKSRIIKKECVINSVEFDSFPPEHTYFLNFNYTNVVDKYWGTFKPLESSINNIHGSLNGGQPPIFGFGDEMDKDYVTFEDYRLDESFEHIKSFKYLEADSYRNLLEFINSNPFQVQIFGHSCGISDRTMLNTIFEHENCISIKVFYYETKEDNDFTRKNFSIARHFSDKKSLREKVVNFSLCEPMAQPANEPDS